MGVGLEREDGMRVGKEVGMWVGKEVGVGERKSSDIIYKLPH